MHRQLRHLGPAVLTAWALWAFPVVAADATRAPAFPTAPGTCATTDVLLSLRSSPEIPAALRARPLSRPGLATSADGRFLIHYPEARPAAAALAAGNTDDFSVLAGRVARTLATARTLLVDHWGWADPGGERPLDVYLQPGPERSRAVPEEDPGFSAEEGSPSFLVISGAPGNWPAQAFHQYLHALQLGYSTREAAWFYEASALRLERRLAGAVDLPAEVVRDWMATPHRSLAAADPALHGGAAAFLAFVGGMHSDLVVQRAWEQAGRIFGDNTLAALNTALRLTDMSTLDEVWREFSIWLAFPEPDQRPRDLYGELARVSWSPAPARVIDSLPDAGTTVELEPFGVSYVRLRNLGDIGAIEVNLESDWDASLSVDLLVSWRPASLGWMTVPLRVERGRGSLRLPVEPHGEAVLVVRNNGEVDESPRRVEIDIVADPSFPFDLAFLSADAAPGRIEVAWGSDSESRMYGWNVYRATDTQGPFRQLTRFPIPSRGDSDTPLGYQYTDTNVVPGTRYYYLVEGITLDGLARRSPVMAGRAIR